MTSLEELSDEDLVERVRGGDDAAFRVLTQRYSKRLQGQIEGKLAPPLRRKVAASDILQESYLAAYRRFADFEDRGEGSFGRWFAQIVQRKVLEAVRRHAGTQKRSVAHEVTQGGRSPAGFFAAGAPTPSQIAVGNELRDAAKRALDELPESYREVLTCLRDQRLTLEETAERMDRSPAAVKQLYHRALARLEELMGLDAGRDRGRRRPTR